MNVLLSKTITIITTKFTKYYSLILTDVQTLRVDYAKNISYRYTARLRFKDKSHCRIGIPR